MDAPTSSPVIVAASDHAGDPLARWWGPIWGAWPAHPAPTARFTSLADLSADLAAPAHGPGPAPEGPILAVLGPEVSAIAVCQLVDRLQQHYLPAVLLVPEVTDTHRRLAGAGIFIERSDAPPARLAAYLHALAQRQAAIAELRRDIHITAQYHGGVRGEIDRIHDELNLAAAVQQELLPKTPPEVRGLACAALFRPAGYVSGDIYDLVRLDEHRLGFFIADAVGHGVPAALLTMVISRSLRLSQPARPGGPIVAPGEAMSRLNEELLRSQRGSPRFSTAIYGVIDARTREVTLASAGHPPPLRLKGRRLLRVPSDGALLGVFTGERYDDFTFTLEPGETLLLHSDGFETAFGQLDAAARRKASDCYLDTLAGLPWPDEEGQGSLSRALDELVARMDAEAGSLHQVDDVTALAIAALPMAAEGALSIAA